MPPFPSPEFHPSLPPQVPPPPPVEPSVGKPFFNGQTVAPPRQKGRPRKRKPKDLEGMTASLGNLVSTIYNVANCYRYYSKVNSISNVYILGTLKIISHFVFK